MEKSDPVSRNLTYFWSQSLILASEQPFSVHVLETDPFFANPGPEKGNEEDNQKKDMCLPGASVNTHLLLLRTSPLG